jgi:hypothetical protein
VSTVDVVAGLISLQLRARNYWYAVLCSNPAADEDPAYRHGTDHPLYLDRDTLVADLERDGFAVDADLAGAVDVDHARSLIGYAMTRDEIDVVITAWNALDDLTAALGVRLDFFGRLANRSYDKLFAGLNLVAITPPGRWYTPSWRPRELAKIDQVLREGGDRVVRCFGAESDHIED